MFVSRGNPARVVYLGRGNPASFYCFVWRGDTLRLFDCFDVRSQNVRTYGNCKQVKREMID